jgi:hypothetical protein
VREYLVRLNSASAVLTDDQRIQLVTEVAARIDASGWDRPGASLADARALLDQFGEPEVLVRRLITGQRPAIEARRRRLVMMVALLMICVGIAACVGAILLASAHG